MTEFIIFNGNDKFKIEFNQEKTISELKNVISKKMNFLDINNFNIFLEKTGFIDINPFSINSQLSSLKNNLSKLNPPYSIFCFDKSNIENNIQNNNLCFNKLISNNNLSQICIKIKEKNNIKVCISCAKHCNNIILDNLDSENIINEENFICQCDSDENNKICKFLNFKLDNIFEQNERKEFESKCITLLNKKKEEMENYLKKKKMEELNKKILERDFDFMEMKNLLGVRIECYKDKELQAKIKELIPKRPSGSTSEQYVKILLKWFKKDFFSWCNKPKCPQCGQNDKNMTFLNSDENPSSEEDKKFLAYRIEKYLCNNCKREVKFVRYHKTIKLLETRTGRCGEWSNLFGGILYTCGFKTRLINNFEDHVWNEFYNEEEKRWIHVDPCEEAYDTPLVYEQGWGRVMTFILGLSDDGLVEVTPRYIKDWKIVSERRSEKMIAKLKNIIEEVNKKMMDGMSSEEIKNIEERRKTEIESFEKKIKLDLYGGEKSIINDEEKIGRQSGSLEWRKNRGEC